MEGEEIRKLYIIGNGFDLHHELPTGYDNFRDYLLKNNSKVYHDMITYFSFKPNAEYWKTFEENLGLFSHSDYFIEHNEIDVKDDDVRPSTFYGLEDAIVENSNQMVVDLQESFYEWVSLISSMMPEFSDEALILPIDKNSLFLSFNYTLTLQLIYKVPDSNIHHIHGSTKMDSESIKFGHCVELKDDPEIDENGDSNWGFFTEAQNAAKYPVNVLRKPTRDILKRSSNFLDRINGIDKIIVMGHSFGTVDLPYFMEIVNRAPTAKWEISYYTNQKKAEYMECMFGLGVKPENIKLFKLLDYKG